VLTLALYAFEFGGFVLAMALFKYGDRLSSLTTREAVWIVVPLASLLAVGVCIVACWRALGGERFVVTLATNVVSVVIVLALAEGLIRVVAVSGPQGVSVANTLLLPKDWDWVRSRNAGLLKNAPTNISYFVSDQLLGWTVGPSRTSADGLYVSSREGIRSARADIAYADDRAPNLLAAVGDSYTFGLEVRFEQSWAAQLEILLGPEFRLLNFGVDGYGVDQAYLRYQRDVRPWRPALVLFGFIEHDLTRSMVVYPFVSFPEWGFPFSKPRFALNGGGLELLNAPLLGPDDVLGKRAISELPFIDFDPGYHASEWHRHPWHASYLLRFLVSRFPRPTPTNPRAEGEIVGRINTELLLAFVRRATTEGTVPLIVYFPSRGDFQGQDRSAKSVVLRNLQRSGVAAVDLTSCIGALGPGKAFIAGRPHYAPAGNAAVARCLLPVVRERVQTIRARSAPAKRAPRAPASAHR
jgi:hypothetical protein